MDQQSAEVVPVTEVQNRAPAIVINDALARFADVGTGLALAKQYADQLADVVKSQKLSVKMGGGKNAKDYLLVEAWTFLGSSVGVMPRTVGVVEIRNGKDELDGFEATVEAIRVATGEVVSRAMARCYLDESLTRRDGSTHSRWDDKFAAFSMAQTRATSKAMSQPLRWISILAGYSGTPYEEATDEMMRESGGASGDVKSKVGQRAKATAPKATAGGGGDLISTAQAKRLWAIAYGSAERVYDDSKQAEGIVRAVLNEHEIPPDPEKPDAGPSSRMIPWKKYDDIVAAVEGWESDPPPENEDAPF